MYSLGRDKDVIIMLKNLKWNAILTALIYVVAGAILIIFPDKVQNVICNIIGLVGIILGVIRIFMYLSAEVQDAIYRNDFVEGIVLILIGILVIYQKAIIQSLIPFIVAIVIIVDGFVKLQDGIDAKRLGYDKSYIYVIFAAISIIVGLIVMFNLVDTGNILFQILGGGLVYCGVSDIVSVVFIANRVKKFIETAKKEGATALFGEKYGDVVRVINIGGYSIELCGGTHLSNSSQIGSFKIISESGVAAGVRRIEAVTGFGALEFYNEREKLLNSICENFKANPKNILAKVSSSLEENKKLNREVEILKSKLSGSILDEIINEKQQLNGIDILMSKVSNIDMDTLRNIGDKIKEKLNNFIILLASENEGKVNFISMVSDEPIKKGIKAGDIIKIAATICGGGGGGRPNMAQAGGKDPSKIDEAIEKALDFVKQQL